MKTKLLSALFILSIVGCSGNLSPEQTFDLIKFIDEGISNVEKMKISKAFFVDAGYPEEPKEDRNLTKSQFQMAFRQVSDGSYINACLEINNVYLKIYQVILDREIKKATTKEITDELPGRWLFLEDERKEYAAAGLNAMLGSPKSLLTGEFDAKPIQKPATITEAVAEVNKLLDAAKQKLSDLKTKFKN